MPSFPIVLTNAQWQKKKGLFAKSKATGIGEALVALEKAYNSSGYALDPAKLGTETLDPIVFQERLTQFGKSLQAQAAKIDAAAAAVQKKLDAAKTTFAGNTSVIGVLGRIETDLANFRASLKPAGHLTVQLKEDAVAAYKKHLTSDGVFTDVVTKGIAAKTEAQRRTVLSEVKKLEANPSIDFIHTLWKGNSTARVLRTTPNFWDVALIKRFPKLTAQILPGSAMQQFNQLPWVDNVGNEEGGSASQRVVAMIRGARTAASEKRAVQTFALQYSNSLIKYQDFCKALAKLEAALKKAAA